MLTLTALLDPEYVISSVALGIDEYYAGVGEAPGVWAGRFAPEVGLVGLVDADDLRAVVAGHHPATGVNLLAGRPKRKVNVFDATFSAPKGVSVLWALGADHTAGIVTRCHTDAVATALSFLEDKAAVARQQSKGVRRRVPTTGFAVATFAHRTSREGDPQLHSHCLIANVVRRLDGSHVAFDGNPLHDWAKAAGSVYQAEIQRLLSQELGVEWGPERNGCREMAGFSTEALRAFSKRTVAIEAELEASGAVYESAAARMRADDAASLATRPRKDHSLTPTLLAERWGTEAKAVGLDSPEMVEAAVLGRRTRYVGLSADEVVAGLLDPETGLCATEARFDEAKVVERICAASAGRLTTDDILALAADFLASEHVIRLVPDANEARRRPPQWSMVAHRQLENTVLDHLGTLVDTPVPAADPDLVEQALAAEGCLGPDQEAAVRALCGPGPALRSMISPGGYGKTTAVHAGAAAATSAGRPVLGLATTNQAVGGLRSVGIGATTIARLRLDLQVRPLAPGTVVILDEISQVATRDAVVVLGAVVNTPGAQLWCLGDPRQSQAVGAGGLGAELSRLGKEGTIPAPALVVNRRQRDALDRMALAELRAGHAGASQAIRTEAGWEHEEATPLATREAMAEAVTADVGTHGAANVVALAVSHADCEDIADRIRARLAGAGHIHGDALTGPGWGTGAQRSYARGDRVLLHTKPGPGGMHNGSTGTVVAVEDDGLRVAFDKAGDVTLAKAFVAGRRRDGNPKLSHAWCRTVEGAQGGTWEAVHLLGSSSLDALVGYTGQSRGRAPTHTWNTRPLVVADHGGQLADERSATEVVLGGLRREPVTTFAAADDPWIVDARLMAERDEHLGVLAGAPPDPGRSLDQERARADREARILTRASEELERAEAALAGFGALTGLRRSGRAERSQAEHALARARDRLEAARASRRVSEHRVAEVEAAEARRACFDADNAWRVERVTAIDAELNRHWSTATLAAVRQDDPLAFGIERLRAARATYAADLDAYRASLPPDRRTAVAEARRRLAAREQDLRETRYAVEDRRRQLEIASKRHWGRRDKDGVVRARRALERAEDAVAPAVDGERTARLRLDAEASNEHKRTRALAATEPQRVDLTETVAELDAALDDTRAARVTVLADEAIVPAHLVAVLGEPPADIAARQVWRGLAGRIESYRDRHPEALCHEGDGSVVAAIGPRRAERWMSDPEWDELAGQLRHGPALVAMAAEIDGAPGVSPVATGALSWTEVLERAGALMEAQRRAADRGLERGLGLGM
ncbi:MAG: MobF family relaxase [Acidimicrobiales bacterium]